MRNIKKRVINDFLTLYKDEIINTNDYILKIDLLNGFSIIRKDTKECFASSKNFSLKLVSFNLQTNETNNYQIKKDCKLHEYFNVYEFVDIKYDKNVVKSFIYKVQLTAKNIEIKNLKFIQDVKFFYNSKTCLNGYSFTNYPLDSNANKMLVFKPDRYFFDKYLPLDDLVDFIILFHISRNKNIAEMFPEITIPSAYDFSDFKERIELARMIYY